MLVKSSIFAAMSGKVAGFVAAHNRGGQYVRNFVIPTNPSTPAQQTARDHLAALAIAWEGLTDAYRESWASYAAAVPVVNRLGDPTHLSGFNWFVGTNALRLQVAMTVQSAAPVILSRAALSPISVTVADGDPASLSVTFSPTDDWADTNDGALVIFSSRPMPATRNFFKGPFRFCGTVPGNNAIPPTSPAVIPGAFSAQVGQRIYVRAVAINPDGRTSPPQIVSAVAA